MKIRLVFLNLIFILVFSSCTNQIKDKTVTKATTEEYGVEFGYYHESGNASNQLIHRIEKSNQYKPTISIKNNYQEMYTYRVFCLLDYKIVPINENNKYLDLNLESGEESILALDLKNLNEGLHDVIVILVRDPENTLEEVQYINPEVVYLARRVTLIVNRENNDISSQLKFNTIPSTSTSEYSSTPFVTINKLDKFAKYVSKISKSEFSTLYLHYTSIYNSGGELTTNNPPESSAAIISIQGKDHINVSYPFIKFKDSGDIITQINIKDSKNLPSNLIIGVVRNPYTIQENVFDSEVLFTNLITVTN